MSVDFESFFISMMNTSALKVSAKYSSISRQQFHGTFYEPSGHKVFNEWHMLMLDDVFSKVFLIIDTPSKNPFFFLENWQLTKFKTTTVMLVLINPFLFNTTVKRVMFWISSVGNILRREKGFKREGSPIYGGFKMLYHEHDIIHWMNKLH